MHKLTLKPPITTFALALNGNLAFLRHIGAQAAGLRRQCKKIRHFKNLEYETILIYIFNANKIVYFGCMSCARGNRSDRDEAGEPPPIRPINTMASSMPAPTSDMSRALT